MPRSWPWSVAPSRCCPGSGGARAAIPPAAAVAAAARGAYDAIPLSGGDALVPAVIGERRDRHGKEVAARLLHAWSSRRERRLVPVNCAAIPNELMESETDRKIAEELQRTHGVQRMADVERQALERESATADMQREVVRSEQMVRIAETNALAAVETSKGEAAALRARAEAEAAALERRAAAEAHQVRLRGDAEAEVTRAGGAAKAAAYREGTEALGTAGYAALQLAGTLAEHGVKLVPDIAVGGGATQGSGLLDVLVARMLAGAPAPSLPAGPRNGA